MREQNQILPQSKRLGTIQLFGIYYNCSFRLESRLKLWKNCKLLLICIYLRNKADMKKNVKTEKEE